MSLAVGLGVDHVIDFTHEDATGSQRRYDVIIDIAGNRALSSLRRHLTKRGTLVIVGGETRRPPARRIRPSVRADLLSPFVSQTRGMLASKEDTASLEELRALIDAGGVTPSWIAGIPFATRRPRSDASSAATLEARSS